MSIARHFPARHLRLLLLLLLGLASAAAAAAERAVDRATLKNLSALTHGNTLALDRFPNGPTGTAPMRFERVEIYAKDAHLYVLGANGSKQEIPRSDKIFLRGRAADGSATRIAMTLNPDGTFANGNGHGPEGAFALEAKVDAVGTHTFSARPLESTLPTPDAFQMVCGNEKVDLGLHPIQAANDLSTQLRLATSTPSPGADTASGASVAAPNAPAATQAAYRGAVIAIDTDSEFMSRLFSNNTTSATTWIASMFNTMNTMYETDLQVQLLIGTTFLRTSAASDPYTGLGQNTSSSQADLDLFGSYWKNNEGSVPRQFAILLSGAIASSGGCSAAGIAWINQYCQKGFASGSDTVGSYSVNKVCTNIGIDPNGTFDARIVGHEIGHNFGASHTHCTNTSTGAAPTGTNTIDQCYNGESGSGCYSGPTSCPSGQSSGTIMSYCNISGCSGSQNQLHFHPTQINSVLLPKITANTPSCLMATSDEIFLGNFGG